MKIGGSMSLMNMKSIYYAMTTHKPSAYVNDEIRSEQLAQETV